MISAFYVLDDHSFFFQNGCHSCGKPFFKRNKHWFGDILVTCEETYTRIHESVNMNLRGPLFNAFNKHDTCLGGFWVVCLCIQVS